MRLQLQRPEKFEIGYLKRITQQFSPKLIIGRGGFGTVYKGKKDNGEFIAVKVLNQTITQIDDTEFKKEVLNVMHISHPNIVRLEGYCINKDEELITHEGTLLFAEKQNRLICFEYLPSGSLEVYLNNEDKCRVPNWNERYNIIKGLCKGLHYLHEGRSGGYILHLDLKPANVLLDKNMIPKIADFGQSRLRQLNEGQTHTKKIVGTRGYMPPEYIGHGAYGKKTDVYSLGVIIMEIIAGKRKYPDEQLHEVREKWNEASCEEHEQVQKCIKLALDCMKEEPEERPDMKEVIEILGICEDDMNHHPDGIEEHSVINIDSSEVDPLLEERHGLLRRCMMTADKKSSPPEILTTAVTGRTQWQRMMNSRFLCGAPFPVIIGILVGFFVLMYSLPYIEPSYEVSRPVTITVEEASFTRFALVTSRSSSTGGVLTYNLSRSCSTGGVLTYNLSVMMSIYNPSMYEPRVTKPMEAAFFFGGQRFHVVQLRDRSLTTTVVSMSPLSGNAMLDTAGVAEFRKDVSTRLFEVEMVVAGEVMYEATFSICSVQATCPFKLVLAPPDGRTTQLELFQKVKCTLNRKCSSYQQ